MRVLLVRIAVIVLVSYCAYLLYAYLRSFFMRSSSKESADYDHAEWEKIKKKLEE